MDRIVQHQSLIRQLQNVEIKKQFFDYQKHKSTIQNSRKIIFYYQKLSEQFQKSYKYLYDLPNALKEIVEEKNTINKQLINFKTFLKEFFDVFIMISDFQIQTYSKIRNSRFDDIDSQYQKFIFALQNASKVQEQFQKNKEDYRIISDDLIKDYDKFNRKLTKTQLNFMPKYLTEQIRMITDKISRKQALQDTLNSNITTINTNTRQFQQKLTSYRQKILINKYQYIQKINKTTKNSKQSIIEITTYLYNYINNQKDLFAIDKYRYNDKMLIENHQKLDLTEFILKCTSDYDKKIENYLKIMRCLELCFKDIGNEIKFIKQNHSQIVDLFIKENQYNEFNIQEISSSLEFYLLFFKNISQLTCKIAYNESNLVTLQKKVQKQKEITLSIAKYHIKVQRQSPTNKNMMANFQFPQKPQTPTNGKSSIHSIEKQKNSKIQYIQSLFQEMSEDYITKIILKVYTDFKETVFNIRNNFLKGLKKQKLITDDSMDISYMSERHYGNNRRPSKKQLWLWKQWRKQIQNVSIDTEDIKKQHQKIIKYLQLSKIQENQFQNLNCAFICHKKIKGILKLMPSSIWFSSMNNKCELFIPFDKIDNIDIEMNLISNTFTIETLKGNLEFADNTVGSVKKFFVSVQKAIDFYNENRNKNDIQKIIDLKQQQISYINKRKIQIIKDLENTNQYEHCNTIILQNVRINDVYRIVFSDQKLNFKDKEYQCFFDAIAGKFNNFNLVYQKFNHPGPEFYSQDKEFNFTNCPIFSKRNVQMDHTLPKVPFFPPSCHVKQTIKVYWVSHEQFHVIQKNVTSGAPYTQYFYSVLLTIVQKIQNNVQLRFFFKIVQVVDFSLKRMIIPKAIDEIKWGNNKFCEEVKKIMMGYKIKTKDNIKQRQSNTKTDQSNISQKTIVKQYKETINKLQTKNKYLFYLLIAVFLLNLLLNMII